MRRRDLLILVGGTVIPWPVETPAQTQRARVGILPFVDWRGLDIWRIFVDELRNQGWIEGKNLEFDIRPVDGHVERYPDLAAELVALRPDVIVVGGATGPRAVREKTSTIPIVMIGGDDPVRLGLISSLAHPGGNITGISNQGANFHAKAFEFLLEARPSIKRVCTLLCGSVITH
jgi:putative ABC transport system substrate-binding protein